MRIAYILQTYKGLHQISRLVRALRSDAGEHLIIITHNGPAADFERLSALPGVVRAVPAPGGRGRFSTVDALLSALTWLQDQPLTFDWVVVLSGQDYPIRPIAELRAYLASARADGFFYHFDVAAGAVGGPMAWTREEAEERYLFSYSALRPTASRMQRLLLKAPQVLLRKTHSYRLHTSYGLLFGIRPQSNPFSKKFKLVGGSYWMTINSRAVNALLSFVDKTPDVVQYFRRTIVPEESFIQTVLVNDELLSISAHELRYYDFRNSRHGRPRVFSAVDLPTLMSSGCFFARKFDFEADCRLAEHLDEIVLPKHLFD